MADDKSKVKPKKEKTSAQIFLIKFAAAIIFAAICTQSLYYSMTSYHTSDPAALINKGAYIYSFVIFIALFTAVSMIFKHFLIAAGSISLFINAASLVNHYELLWHGTVLTYGDLSNAGVAATTLSNYRIDVTKGGILIAAAMVLSIFAIVISIVKKISFKRIISASIIALLTLIALIIVQITGISPVNIADNQSSWEQIYYQYGFVLGTMDNLQKGHTVIKKPEGYTPSAIADAEGKKGKSDDYPDIILILNETWFDLSHWMPLETDVDYMANYKALEASKGYAGVVILGGGTNNSEYELLTSNSLTLFRRYDPFNYMDMKDSSSIVNYLEKEGYSTMGAAAEPSQNYNRLQGYSDLGFDKCYFLDDFTDIEYYDDRKYPTDASVFRNFTRFYEEMPEDQPRLAYLLTIQNHGYWAVNDESLDTVHVTKADNYSLPDDVLNEYLSCVKMTDDLIEEITDYYNNIDRKVIVCMAGDHAPSLVNYPDDSLVENEKDYLHKKQTPYFIWTNYKTNAGEKNVDLCALVPEVLNTAGLPLSPYYTQILDLSKNVQCFSNIYPSGDDLSGSVIGYAGDDDNFGTIDDGTEESEALRRYLYMEYNNIGDEQKIQRLFDP